MVQRFHLFLSLAMACVLFLCTSFFYYQENFYLDSFSDFEQIILDSSSSDFFGLNIGDPKQVVYDKLPNDALDIVYGDKALHYVWFLDDKHRYNLDLFFDEKETLFSIGAVVHFYDENKNEDIKEANSFFQTLTNMITAKCGDSHDKEDYKHAYWNLDDKGIQIDLYENEVYFHTNRRIKRHIQE